MSADASDGIRQSPRGDSVTEPTLGPSGTQERLNCWLKNRLVNTRSHFNTVSPSYFPPNEYLASRYIFDGVSPDDYPELRCKYAVIRGRQTAGIADHVVSLSGGEVAFRLRSGNITHCLA